MNLEIVLRHVHISQFIYRSSIKPMTNPTYLVAVVVHQFIDESLDIIELKRVY